MKPDISNQEHFYTFIGKSKINAKEAARSLETSRIVRDNSVMFRHSARVRKVLIWLMFMARLGSETINKVYNKSEDLYKDLF